MTNTMRIWDAVSKTDPAHTRHVQQRGGFTAINANYQIMMATKQFGPVGDGWGYSNGEPIFHDRLVIVPVTLWHSGDRDKAFGPVYGCAEWQTGGGKLDSDAPKKAATDGLTKLLSHLGFNADVFLGMYDDQKYVAEVVQEFAEKKRAEEMDPKNAPQSVANFLEGLRAMFKSGGDTAAYYKAHIAATPNQWRDYIKAEAATIAANANPSTIAAG